MAAVLRNKRRARFMSFRRSGGDGRRCDSDGDHGEGDGDDDAVSETLECVAHSSWTRRSWRALAASGALVKCHMAAVC